MYYELYIDVFFLENFMLDSLLLLVVNRVMNNGRSCSRILLGGAAWQLSDLSGGCCSASFSSQDACVPCILVSSVMVCTGLQIMRLSQFVQAFLLLYAAAFLTGGVMQLFRPYMRYASVFYAAAAVSYVLILKLWKVLLAYVQTAECDPQGDSVYRQGGKAAESSP